VTDLPVLVDADTGGGHTLAIARTTRELARAGAAGMHLEDQIHPKRCGHRPGKVLISQQEMVDRIKAAVDARPSSNFVVMARTDAARSEGITGAVQRAVKYISSGADMIFAEALTDLEQYRQFTQAVAAPVLANMTEFGVTPLYTVDQLRSVNVRLALYPLSAFRAMSISALNTYRAIHEEGTQASVLKSMQTRDELYTTLDYARYEAEINQFMERSENKGSGPLV